MSYEFEPALDDAGLAAVLREVEATDIERATYSEASRMYRHYRIGATFVRAFIASLRTGVTVGQCHADAAHAQTEADGRLTSASRAYPRLKLVRD